MPKSNKNKIMKNWNEFLHACAIAWETEGKEASEVHRYLLRVQKHPRMTLIQVAAAAWQMYKEDQASE
jgi:hypothetical protein